MKSELFIQAYKGLNPAQREAVDAIEGPVLVIAGPGTGKTQVLAIRIANILTKTDAGAGSILALTFTRAGVRAMRERLESYIGGASREVTISTFHSFAQDIVSKHYSLIDIDTEPKLLDDSEAVLLVDELLENGDFEYLRPRGNPATYFNDLKSIISLLKRERISSLEFMATIDSEINNLKTDPENISSRGASKGQLKKETEKKIESLERTREVVVFYEKYEAIKRERSLMDYDDVLSFAVKIIEESEEVRDKICEQYLYVLVDEHQDSSGIQNSFLKAVWGEVEKPNIFVVGDDRQLIYGFGGASMEYFEEFSETFLGTKKITLSENYRSTKTILDIADALLKSNLADKPLSSNHPKDYPVYLNEYSYSRDEIIGAGLYFKQKIDSGVKPEECALLVPKNKHVRIASKILRSMGLLVKNESSLSLFEMREMDVFTNILSVVENSYNSLALSQVLLSDITGIDTIEAHKFLYERKEKEISVENILQTKGGSLFESENKLFVFGSKLKEIINASAEISIDELILKIGNTFFIDTAKNGEQLVRNVELIRTLVHLAIHKIETNDSYSLKDFLIYLNRLKSYGHTIPVASILSGSGITIQTLHSSKGLEYENVWIAHMNESVVLSGKKIAFTLPEVVQQKIEERDEAVIRREVYVAITRAKTNCIISYSAMGVDNKPLELLGILYSLPQTHFIKKNRVETEAELLKNSPTVYLPVGTAQTGQDDFIKNTAEMVAANYPSKKVSVTLLNNFFECPWKWYFRNFLQLPEQKTNSLFFGSAVHKTIEEILKQNKKPSQKFIEEALKKALLKEGIRDDIKSQKMFRDGIYTLEHFMKNFYPSILKEHSTERSISYKDSEFPNLLMHGKIDLIETVSKDSVLVTDFKTGGVKTPGVIEKLGDEGELSDLMRQLAMYSYLIEGSDKNVKVKGSRLLFLEAKEGDKNNLYSTEIKEEQIEKLKDDIREYEKSLKNSSWVTRDCNFKPWGGATTECPYCTLIKK